jgi:hypothetical protein
VPALPDARMGEDQPIMVKKAISDGKAAAALLNAGVPVIATGLSHKGATTQASRGNC